MGRKMIGPKYRRGMTISVNPDLLEQLDDLRGTVPRSRIIEALIEAFIQDPKIIKGVV